MKFFEPQVLTLLSSNRESLGERQNQDSSSTEKCLLHAFTMVLLKGRLDINLMKHHFSRISSDAGSCKLSITAANTYHDQNSKGRFILTLD